MEPNILNENLEPEISESSSELSSVSESPISSEDTVSTEEEMPQAPDPENDPVLLRAEIESLRAALEARDREQQRIMEEMGEFSRLFPNIAVRDVPETVWQNVQRGIPLSAAYALYEKKTQADAHQAETVNRRNAERSAGAAGLQTAGEFFSPDEVRAMSPSEVRSNYKKIRESMKKWR